MGVQVARLKSVAVGMGTARGGGTSIDAEIRGGAEQAPAQRVRQDTQLLVVHVCPVLRGTRRTSMRLLTTGTSVRGPAPGTIADRAVRALTTATTPNQIRC